LKTARSEVVWRGKIRAKGEPVRRHRVVYREPELWVEYEVDPSKEPKLEGKAHGVEKKFWQCSPFNFENERALRYALRKTLRARVSTKHG
jgi:hypothetical protein